VKYVTWKKKISNKCLHGSERKSGIEKISCDFGGLSGRKVLEWILEIRCEILHWVELVEGRQQWLSAVNLVMNPEFIRVGNSLDSKVSIYC
jgi:hypothetical protein